MPISDTSCMMGVLTIALLTAEFGQVWAEYECHDVTPQLWRRLQGKRSIQGNNCDEDVKSVQSALSDLKHPLEHLQSQCNYRPFVTEQHLNGTLSETKLHPDLPKRNGQW